MFKKVKSLFKAKKTDDCRDCAKNYPHKCPLCRLKDEFDNDVRSA